MWTPSFKFQLAPLFFILWVGGFSTGEEFPEVGGDTLFLLFLLLDVGLGLVDFFLFLTPFFRVPCGGAGDLGFFLKQAFKMHPFLSFPFPPFDGLSRQALQRLQSVVR